MKIIIRLSDREEAKALPILLRHSPGTVLKNRTYELSAEVVHELTQAGIQFTEIRTDVDETDETLGKINQMRHQGRSVQRP